MGSLWTTSSSGMSVCLCTIRLRSAAADPGCVFFTLSSETIHTLSTNEAALYNATTYIHCKAGRSCSVPAVTAYLTHRVPCPPLASHVHTRPSSVATEAYPPTLDPSRNLWHSRLASSEDGQMGQRWPQMTKSKTARDADYRMPVKVCHLPATPGKLRKVQTLGSS